jgi:hypothetical protein
MSLTALKTSAKPLFIDSAVFVEELQGFVEPAAHASGGCQRDCWT